MTHRDIITLAVGDYTMCHRLFVRLNVLLDYVNTKSALKGLPEIDEQALRGILAELGKRIDKSGTVFLSKKSGAVLKKKYGAML